MSVTPKPKVYKIAYKYPTKCTSKRGGGAKQSNTVTLFVAFVPQTHIGDDTREGAAFCDPEEETNSKESGEPFGGTYESAHDTSNESESS